MLQEQGLFSIPKRLPNLIQKAEEEEEEEEEDYFGQSTSLIARDRASATLPNVIHLCQTKCQ